MTSTLPSIGTRLGSGWGTFVKRAEWEGSTFGEVLSEQLRFRTTHAGATSVDDVRPDSALTRRLWKEPATRDFAQGVLDLAHDVSGGPSPLRGFSLSTSQAGYVANRAVHNLRGGAPSIEAFEAGVAAARNHTDRTVAVRKGNWLHLGPDRSSGFQHALRHPGFELNAPRVEELGRGIKTLLHELNHVGSPRPADARMFDWLSEGSAETLARWPGRVEDASRTLRLPTPHGAGAAFDRAQHPYQEEVDSVRSLLRMAGIDPSDATQFRAAETLLNVTPEDGLPRVFGAVIAERHGDPTLAAKVEDIMTRRVAKDGSNADPERLLRLERSLAARV